MTNPTTSVFSGKAQTADAPAISANRPTLHSIQGLRACAAMAVLLFHLQLFSIGFAGVDVFFVISGFIMGSIGTRERPVTFLRRRLARIVPIYWLVTIGTCTLAMIPGAMRNFSFDASSLVRSLLFIPYRNASGTIEPLIVPGWTLNYEMFFYVIFATLLLTKQPRQYALLVLGGLGVIGSVYAINDPIVQTYTSPLLLEFAAGMALSLHNPLSGVRAGLAAFVAGMLGFVAMFAWGDLSVSGLARAVSLGGASMLLVAGALAIEVAGKWPRIFGARAMGDASYSLYLTHGLVLAVVHKLAIAISMPTWASNALGLAACIVTALAIYRWFEHPTTRKFR